MFARHFIDSPDFARNGRELCEVVPVAEMPRLQDLLAGSGGEISFTLRGLPDVNGKPALEVAVDGVCQLRCQRCLDGFAYTVKFTSRLVLSDAGELDELSDDGDDAADMIAADSHLDVLNLVEEEILLSLPIAPKHPPGVCQLAEEGSGRSGANPFAVLAALKKS
jgi:uncharacterized protein